MPADEPPVAPALTLSQWERGTCDLGDALGEHGITWMPGEGQRSGYVQAWVQSERTGLPLGAIVDTPDGLRALAAAANAALPDGHPGKITAHAVWCLGEVLANYSAWVETDASDFLRPQLREYGRVSGELAAALRAILPPEPDDGR